MKKQNELKIALVQTSLIWEEIKSNLGRLELKFSELPPGVDIIVLPEMFTTGFSMNPEKLAETMSGDTVTWMKTLAQNLDSVIVGSIIISDQGKHYNRLVWMQPDGEYLFYDKRHLFGYGGEDKPYTAGNNRTIVNYKGWTFNLNICYDLRFPVWSRNQNDYDVLIYVANWPMVRSIAWRKLLQARAIENLSYVVGVNRVGEDKNGLIYQGDSMIIFPDGSPINNPANKDEIIIEEISLDMLENFRDKFQFWKDADKFELK